MKSIKYFSLALLFSAAAYAGNDSTFPGKTALERDLAIKDLLSRIPADSLIKEVQGRTLIPMSTDSIRRLTMRASVDGKTHLTLDSGEKFSLSLDAQKKLIDFMKAAEIIDRAELRMEAGQ